MNFPETLCPWLEAPYACLEEAALAGRLGHGWLVSGPRGTGKSNLVYLLAGRMLSGRLGGAPPAPATPREIVAASAALATAEDLHPDLHRVRAEEGKASITVDQIRSMTADLGLTPHLAGPKIVVMEHAETMTMEAANALLKSLEEPTPNTFLFLLAERPGRLPATIRSRCQHLRLRPPSAEAAREWLEGAGIALSDVPAARLAAGPIVWAGLMESPDKISEIKSIWRDIEAISHGRIDAHGIAQRWQKGDLDLALECLAGDLHRRIRGSLVGGPSNPVTDSDSRIAENRARRVPVDTLFAGLKMAENLRDQLGRGINEELALTALLLGLGQPVGRRIEA